MQPWGSVFHFIWALQYGSVLWGLVLYKNDLVVVVVVVNKLYSSGIVNTVMHRHIVWTSPRILHNFLFIYSLFLDFFCASPIYKHKAWAQDDSIHPPPKKTTTLNRLYWRLKYSLQSFLHKPFCVQQVQYSQHPVLFMHKAGTQLSEIRT